MINSRPDDWTERPHAPGIYIVRVKCPPPTLRSRGDPPPIRSVPCLYLVQDPRRHGDEQHAAMIAWCELWGPSEVAQICWERVSELLPLTAGWYRLSLPDVDRFWLLPAVVRRLTPGSSAPGAMTHLERLDRQGAFQRAAWLEAQKVPRKRRRRSLCEELGIDLESPVQQSDGRRRQSAQRSGGRRPQGVQESGGRRP